MTHLKVLVTSEDIEKGAPGSTSTCALALALTRAVGVGRFVRVFGPYTGEVYVGAERYVLDDAGRKFVTEFDLQRAATKPQVVTLTLQAS